MKKVLIVIALSWSAVMYSQSTTRFMVVSDMHLYSPVPDIRQTLLYELIHAAIDENVDFLFFTGDLCITGFSEPELEDSVLKDWRFALDTLSAHNIRMLACRGNNDVSSRAAWDSLFKGDFTFPANGPPEEKNLTYAFEYNNILFIALDQYTLSHRINQTWIDSILAEHQQPHIFAAGHEPAFKLLHSNCMGMYPEERNAFWESLTGAGVKVFFCGHDHFYDHAIIDDGDGDLHNDIHQVIAGTGGYLHNNAEFDGDNGRWTPTRIFHEEQNGYVLVEVEDADVTFTWKHRVDTCQFEYGGDAYTFSASSINDKSCLKNNELLQNYPNPFNPRTVISYKLKVESHTDLGIYNILGQKVATLVSARQPAGSYIVEWDAAGFPSGMYFYRLSTDQGYTETRKLVLMR